MRILPKDFATLLTLLRSRGHGTTGMASGVSLDLKVPVRFAASRNILTIGLEKGRSLNSRCVEIAQSTRLFSSFSLISLLVRCPILEEVIFHNQQPPFSSDPNAVLTTL
jgi:hypothetical protein